MGDPHAFHLPYPERNHEIYRAITEGADGEAERMLWEYLCDAEKQILAAYPSGTQG